MKASFEQFIRSTMALNRGTLRSTSIVRRELLAHGGLLHFQAVLVGAGQEEHIIAVEPHEAGNRVGCDRLVGVADMGRSIGIGNGSGEIVTGRVSHCRA